MVFGETLQFVPIFMNKQAECVQASVCCWVQSLDTCRENTQTYVANKLIKYRDAPIHASSLQKHLTPKEN